MAKDIVKGIRMDEETLNKYRKLKKESECTSDVDFFKNVIDVYDDFMSKKIIKVSPDFMILNKEEQKHLKEKLQKLKTELEECKKRGLFKKIFG